MDNMVALIARYVSATMHGVDVVVSGSSENPSITWIPESAVIPLVELMPLVEAYAATQQRISAKRRIDTQAETLRSSLLTSGDGQMLVYIQKEAEARSALAAIESGQSIEAVSYPLLAAEIGITADDIVGVAAIVVARADAIRVLLAQIESTRLAAKAALNAATGDMDSIVSAIEWPEIA